MDFTQKTNSFDFNKFCDMTICIPLNHPIRSLKESLDRGHDFNFFFHIAVLLVEPVPMQWAWNATRRTSLPGMYAVTNVSASPDNV